MGGLIHVGAWDGSEYVNDTRRLLLFEPQAEAFKALERNCPTADLVNAACGAASGEATIHTADPSHSSSLLPSTGVAFAGSEAVTVTTLDEEMRGRTGYDTLRIDTQGYELEVLRGAAETLRDLKRVELEIHDPGTYTDAASREDIDAYLAARGFARITPDSEFAEVVYRRDVTCDIS